MALFDIVFRVLVVVAVLNAATLLLVFGRSWPTDLAATIRSNLRAVGPLLAVLLVVLLVNSIVRDIGVELSWLIGMNVTGSIHAIEGAFVALVQSVASPPLTWYFGNVYVYGYVFLLTFPFLAYALYDDPGPLRVLVVAYAINYGVGLLCYVLFVAYGPRNFMPDLVEPLLYQSWPQSQLLTSEVNVNTNVFPSLHTSLSATVALVATRYHSLYARWTPIAWVLAASIAVSTMYLGIHWLVDVIAGLLLAAGSVAAATRATGSETVATLRRLDIRR